MRPKHNSHCYISLNQVYRPMAEPKFTSLTATAKFQKLSLVKSYHDFVTNDEEEKKEHREKIERKTAKALSKDSGRLSELTLNQAKYLI